MSRKNRTWLGLLLWTCCGANLSLAAERAADLERQAAAALGEPTRAKELALRAVELDPARAGAWSILSAAHAALEELTEAERCLDKALEIQPTRAALWHARGDVHFRLAQFDKALADYDHELKLAPETARAHWKRGIICYYARQFAAGQEQFEGYQTFDDNDVENAVWRYLCMAQIEGPDKARGELLKIKADPRPVMPRVYDLFAGKLPPDGVLAAARAGDPGERELNNRLFYAHLYIGLFHEAQGQVDLAREHITLAAEKYPIGHFMHAVAKVHAGLLKQPADEASKNK